MPKRTAVTDRHGKELQEKEEIKKRWTEYCSELYEEKENTDSQVSYMYLRDLFSIQPTRSTRSSSCLPISRSLVPTRLKFLNQAISITASRIWNYLPFVLRYL